MAPHGLLDWRQLLGAYLTQPGQEQTLDNNAGGQVLPGAAVNKSGLSTEIVSLLVTAQSTDNGT